MGDSLVVRGRHRFSQREGDVEEVVESKAPFAQSSLQSRSFHPGHGQKVQSFSLVDRIDGDDVGMVELGQHLSLALETRQSLGVACQRLGEHLEGYGPLEPFVLSLEHLSHCAASGEMQNPVVKEPTTFHG